MKQLINYLLIGMIVLTGCGESEPIKHSNGEEYFPLQTGSYRIYSIAETVYSEFNPPQEFEYELKTEVVDSFQNQEGGYTYIIYRSSRATESDPWVFKEAWSARINTQHAVLIEGNTAYIRIGLPAFKKKEWNGNAFNTLDEDFYRIEKIGKPYELSSGIEFSDVLIVNQESEVSLLFRDQREEVYARNIGLVYKKSVVIKYCDEVGCFGQQIIKEGVDYVQALKEYGQN